MRSDNSTCSHVVAVHQLLLHSIKCCGPSALVTVLGLPTAHDPLSRVRASAHILHAASAVWRVGPG